MTSLSNQNEQKTYYRYVRRTTDTNVIISIASVGNRIKAFGCRTIKCRTDCCTRSRRSGERRTRCGERRTRCGERRTRCGCRSGSRYCTWKYVKFDLTNLHAQFRLVNTMTYCGRRPPRKVRIF